MSLTEEIHQQVQNWGYYSPLVSNASSLNTALAFANEFLTNISRWSLDIGKVSLHSEITSCITTDALVSQPVVLEEFGMARDEWENIKKGAPSSFYLYE